MLIGFVVEGIDRLNMLIFGHIMVMDVLIVRQVEHHMGNNSFSGHLSSYFQIKTVCNML